MYFTTKIILFTVILTVWQVLNVHKIGVENLVLYMFGNEKSEVCFCWSASNTNLCCCERIVLAWNVYLVVSEFRLKQVHEIMNNYGKNYIYNVLWLNKICLGHFLNRKKPRRDSRPWEMNYNTLRTIWQRYRVTHYIKAYLVEYLKKDLFLMM